MDFLDSSVLPQSVHHMILLKYLLVLTFIIFFTYVGILFGSLAFSLYFKRRAVKTSNEQFKKFSKDLIDQITFNKGTAFALGIIPMLSTMFCYAQLLHLTKVETPFYIFISVLFLSAALVLIYIYKYTFHIKDIFKVAEAKDKVVEGEDSLKDEISSYSHKTLKLHEKSGLYGFILLIVATYVFTGAVQLASDTNSWQSDYTFLGMIFSLNTIAHYLQFITASVALSSATVLYLFYKPESHLSQKSEEYSSFVKNFALKIGLIAVISLPVIIAFTVFVQPVSSLSFEMFGITAVALVILLFLSSLFYLMVKESSLKYRSWLIYLLIVVIAFLILKDQYSFDTATKMHTEILSANYDAYEKKQNESLGISAVKINGADIYNGRCIACHSFDHKVVGPPYNETIPKYEGHIADLVKFIMNPVKKNPAYPAMPNQGLKPNEADAIADWLLKNYKK
jgi:cytochrome c